MAILVFPYRIFFFLSGSINPFVGLDDVEEPEKQNIAEVVSVNVHFVIYLSFLSFLVLAHLSQP